MLVGKVTNIDGSSNISINNTTVTENFIEILTNRLENVIINKILPSGYIGWFNLSDAPDGWVVCDGYIHEIGIVENDITVESTEIEVPNLIGRYAIGATFDIGSQVEAGLPNIDLALRIDGIQDNSLNPLIYSNKNLDIYGYGYEDEGGSLRGKTNFSDEHMYNMNDAALTGRAGDLLKSDVYGKYDNSDINSYEGIYLKGGVIPASVKLLPCMKLAEGWIDLNRIYSLDDSALTFIAADDNVKIQLNKIAFDAYWTNLSGNCGDKLQYRKSEDNNENANDDEYQGWYGWKNYTFNNAQGEIISLNNNEKIQFKNISNQLSLSSTMYIQFAMTGQVNAAGNIQSMLNYSDSCNDYCYYNLFAECESLLTAPELPATTLADGCYQGMFANCTSLTQAPELPATILSSGCYQTMFYHCTSLIQTPKLPATDLAAFCYYQMFDGCSQLTQVSELSATTLAYYCYGSMFNGCTSLTQAPELPAIALAQYCYITMFQNCTSLSSITVRFTEWTLFSEGFRFNWVDHVASIGEFKCPSTLATSSNPNYGNDKVPNGWTIINI